MEDLDHFIKSGKIFQNKKMQQALAQEHAAAEGDEGQALPPEQVVDYFFFYKDSKKSNKAAKK